MKLPEHERAAHKEAFKKMSLAEKADYIFAYYKLELVIILIVLVFAGSLAHRAITHKDATLYLAYANVTAGEELDSQLSDGFVDYLGLNPRRNEVYRYQGIYLTPGEESVDRQYSYASRLKVLGAIDAEQLDVVIMNQEAYDILSATGYLLELDALVDQIDPAAQELLRPALATNGVVVDGSQVAYDAEGSEEAELTIVDATNALEVTNLGVFEGAGLSGTTYLGVIANSPRLEQVAAYLEYLVLTTQ